MSATGPLLSEAARLADEALRLLVSSQLRLEAAGVIVPPDTESDIGELVADAAAFADELLRVADAYGHDQAASRFSGWRRAA